MGLRFPWGDEGVAMNKKERKRAVEGNGEKTGDPSSPPLPGRWIY